MPEPFKNLFNPEMIAQMGLHLARVSDHFDPRKIRRPRYTQFGEPRIEAAVTPNHPGPCHLFAKRL